MYDLVDFTPDNLYWAMETEECPDEIVRSDHHVQYLYDYLHSAEIGAAQIIVEREYVDREFLEDFAAFYVSCFYPYDRFCKRLHFFDRKVTKQEFLQIVRGRASKKSLQAFQRAYLGFIVVRPLPDALIGRTQLKTYGPDRNGATGKDRRHYTAIRNYEVNLAGVRLSVRSMAFQEQDTAVAACATVALWSCFQKTAELFGGSSPRPPAITANATSGLIYRRSLPSTGLTIEQICAAIRANDLDPEVFPEDAITPSLIYGYLRFGIPLLMIVEIEGYDDYHAIALNGYSLVEKPIGEERMLKKARGKARELPTPMVGRRINEIYGHDDQFGPFGHLYIKMPRAIGKPFTMFGQWPKANGKPNAVISPVQVIAPLYRKIRLSYIEARSAIELPIVFAETVLTSYGFKRGDWEWDIHLITTSDYKREIRGNQDLSRERIDYLLFKSQPRFFWRCTLKIWDAPLMELGVDATEFMRSNPVFLVNHFDDEFADLFTGLVQTVPAGPKFHPLFRDVLLTEYKTTKTKNEKNVSAAAGVTAT